MSRRAVRAIVSGRVQGVGYRAWTISTAQSLGLSGWVRNLPDGTVEIAAGGSAAQVEALLAACAHGPAYARPGSVRAEPADEAMLRSTPDGARRFD